jgi:hypothetical protein
VQVKSLSSATHSQASRHFTLPSPLCPPPPHLLKPRSFRWKGGSISNSTPRGASAPPINCTFTIISDPQQFDAATLLTCPDANLWTPPPPIDLIPIVAPAILGPTALAALVYVIRRFIEWRRKSQQQQRAAFSQVTLLLWLQCVRCQLVIDSCLGHSQARARCISVRQCGVVPSTG